MSPYQPHGDEYPCSKSLYIDICIVALFISLFIPFCPVSAIAASEEMSVVRLWTHVAPAVLLTLPFVTQKPKHGILTNCQSL